VRKLTDRIGHSFSGIAVSPSTSDLKFKRISKSWSNRERGISWKGRVWDLLEDEMAPKRGMAERSDNGFCIIYVALSGLVLDVDFFTFLCNRLRFKILISQCFA
jgi:hypothetical protein